MATTLPNTGAIIPEMTEAPDQAVNNAAFTAIDAAVGGLIEEGTWSPDLHLFTGAFSERLGRYIKKGNEVTVYAKMKISTASFSSSSQLALASLPFPVNPAYPIAVDFFLAPKQTTAIPIAISLTSAAYDRLFCYRKETSIPTIFSNSEVVNKSEIQFSFTYRT